jgi:seryl-tRNA synthetase
MHDIKFIRENPEAFDKSMEKRGVSARSAEILAIDEKLRSVLTELQTYQSKRNDLSKLIPVYKKEGKGIDGLLAESEELKRTIPALEAEQDTLRNSLDQILCSLPNILAEAVPVGKDENDNQEIRKWGEIRKFDFAPLEHFDIGEKLGMIDFEQAAKVSGSRFVYLKGALARMERALVNFMLDVHTNEFGYTEVVAPHLVKADAVFGVGQLPKFEEDLFKTTTDHYLISTAEVPLTNLMLDKIVSEETLPLRFTGYTPCYRLEAGSAGRDTKGMVRLHQFSKVELVSITRSSESEAEHERMCSAAETILQRLNLPYRVMLLCSGDTGFSSTRTYDIEVWLPGQNKYREISSCSNCGDFQARRLKARYKELHGTKNTLVHTLNGSGLPIGRTMVAIIENYQNEDGTVSVPEVLVPYMGGLTKIG